MKKIIFGLLVYLLVPLSIVLVLYLYLPFPSRFSWRWFALEGILFILLELILWMETRYILIPAWYQLNLLKKSGWIAIACAFTILLFLYEAPVMTQVMEKFPTIAPQETLEVRSQFKLPGSTLAIRKLKIGLDRVENSDLTLRGNWKVNDDQLWTNDPNASLIVHGKIPRYVSIVFWQSPSAGQVEVQWENKTETFNLQAKSQQAITARFNFDHSKSEEPALTRWIRFGTLPAWLCLAFITSSVFYPVLPNK